MKGKLMVKLSTKLGKAGLMIKKHEPEILVVAGAVGMVTSTVLACKATLKVADVLEEHKTTVNTIHETAAREDMKEKYTTEDEKNDIRIVYTQTAVKVVKEFAPSVILGGLSLGCMFASNNMLRKRNAALAVAYATIDKSFKEYRGRVAERFGSDVEEEIRLGAKEETITEIEVDPETGKEKKVKKKVKVSDPNLTSDYAMYFDENTSAYYNTCYDFNLSMLRAKEAYWTTMLQMRGYVTLNEVLQDIGVEGHKAGMVVGWFYDKKNPQGDDQVLFNIKEVYVRTGDGEHDMRKTIIIDPNVQGEIYSLMEER